MSYRFLETFRRRDQMSRRKFVLGAAGVAAIGASAKAVRALGWNVSQEGVFPVDDPSLESGDVTYLTDRLNMVAPVRMRGYLSRPKAGEGFPAMIVIHDSGGLNDPIRDITRRAAKAGYMAIAPDWQSRIRAADNAEGDEPPQTIVSISSADMVIDIADTIQHLKSTGKMKGDQVGVLGFGWGGGNALLSAAAVKDIGACVMFYADTSGSIELISAMTAPVLGIVASTGTGANAGVPALETALKRNNVPYEIKTYPGLAQGFHDDWQPGRYDAEAARDAWTRTIAHFDKYLKM